MRSLSFKSQERIPVLASSKRRHGTQHNDIQHNDTQHNDTQQ
jgi:hypothetical protein